MRRALLATAATAVALCAGAAVARAADDVFLYGPGAAPDEMLFSEGRGAFAQRAASVPETYVPLAGDFDGDGFDDILWYGPGDAPDALWYGSPGGSFVPAPRTVTGVYRPFVGDFDGDGRDDVFWYGPGAAHDALHLGGPRGTFVPKDNTVKGDFQPVAGDFDGDGFEDILWYGPGDAPDYSWYGAAGLAFEGVAASVVGSYRAFAGDFDGDGRDDVYFYGPGNGYDAIRYGSGRATHNGGSPSVNVPMDGDYRPIVGDFDGDGRDDVFWYAPGTAQDHLWYGTPAKGGFTRFAGVPRVDGAFEAFAGEFGSAPPLPVSTPAPAAPRRKRVRRFTVSAVLRNGRAAALYVFGVQRRSRVVVRCKRKCLGKALAGGRQRRPASKALRLRLRRPLKRGATFEIRVARSGRLGRYRLYRVGSTRLKPLRAGCYVRSGKTAC